MTPPTNRRMVRTTTPATWRWCAVRLRKFPWCSPRLHPRWNRKSMHAGAAIGTFICRSAFGGAHLPSIETIDMRREGPPRGRFISPRLAEAVAVSLSRREQALLFLNRRGYAPLTLCRACGFRLQCPNCDAWLVDHRFKRRLVCHHCGFAMPPPVECSNCHATESFAAVGPGVERLEQEAGELFPQARVLVLSSDLVESGRTSAPGTRRRGGRSLRSHHRHTAGGKRAPFSEA